MVSRRSKQGTDLTTQSASVALVTGASRGIGAVIAGRFAADRRLQRRNTRQSGCRQD
jgi:hypothetical protein